MRPSSLLVAACALGLAAGCNRGSPGGHADAAGESFTLQAPAATTAVKQGDRRTVTLTLDRSRDFRQNVLLAADPPAGLTVELGNKTVNHGDTAEVSLTIAAAADAPVGEQVVRVTGKPDAGKVAVVDVKVRVDPK